MIPSFAGSWTNTLSDISDTLLMYPPSSSTSTNSRVGFKRSPATEETLPLYTVLRRVGQVGRLDREEA